MSALVPKNEVVARVVALKARPASQWPFVWPFFIAEIVLFAIAVDPASVYDARYYADNQRAVDFLHMAAVPFVMFLQAFFALLTVWNIKLKAQVRFADVGTDMSTATHVLVEAMPHHGESLVLPLTTDPVTAETQFVFQQTTWRYSAILGEFRKPEYPTSKLFGEYLDQYEVKRSLSAKASQDAVASAYHYYGKNIVDIRVPEFHELIMDHMAAPFFIFQMFCVSLWLLDDYWMVALFNGFMMFTLECTVVGQRLRSIKSMRDMGALPVSQVRVLRDGSWVSLPSTELVPLDVVQLDSDVPCPADIVLISGSCAANEAMLTGESTPQMKNALPVEERRSTYSIDDHARFTVFSGTSVLVSTPDEVSTHKHNAVGAVGVVIQTGFETKQGNLVRTIIHSQSRVSENSGEAFAFIGLLLVFACAASYYVLGRGLADPTKSRWKLFLTCTQIITNVVPPELPMQLALAVNTSLMALLKLKVFCTEPFRIPFAGKLDTCCFDKTGTLTTDEMLFAGVDVVSVREPTLKRTGITGMAEMVLASCHSLVTVSEKTAGDAMEKAAVDALGWRCASNEVVERVAAINSNSNSGAAKKGGSSTASERVSILKRFPFDSSVKRMSAIVQSSRGERLVVAKGAPEAISKLCMDVPGHYSTVADHYATKGLRVIALAYRRLREDEHDASEVQRDAAEHGLTFCGFAVFECPLKNDSAETIRMLQGGSMRCVMITGDNISTAAAVATQVRMADDSNAFVAVEGDEHTPLRWRHYGDGSITDTIPGKPAWIFVNAEALSDAGFSRVVAKHVARVAVWARCAPHQKEAIVAALKAGGAGVLMAGDGTNDVGGLKQAHVGIAVLNSVLVAQSVSSAPAVAAAQQAAGPERPPPLREGAGFMEMMRHQMAEAKFQAAEIHRKKLEEAQRNAKQNQAVQQAAAMAKVKDAVGVDNPTAAAAMSSLFNDMDDSTGPPMTKLGDASIAAPFTCKSKKMTAIVDIVKLGRCTLVTTLQMYKILALNCLVNAYTYAVLFTDGVKFSQTQTITSGLMIAICFLCLSRSKPLEHLSAQRPINRVFHPYTMVSIFGQFGVHLYSMACSLDMVKFEDPNAQVEQRGEEEADFRPTLLNSVLFLMTTMMAVTTFAVNYQGHPFMTSLRENRPMAFGLFGLAALVVYCASEVDPEFNATMELVPFPRVSMRNEFLSLLAVDVFGTFAVEKISQLVLGKLP